MLRIVSSSWRVLHKNTKNNNNSTIEKFYENDSLFEQWSINKGNLIIQFYQSILQIPSPSFFIPLPPLLPSFTIRALESDGRMD